MKTPNRNNVIYDPENLYQELISTITLRACVDEIAMYVDDTIPVNILTQLESKLNDHQQKFFSVQAGDGISGHLTNGSIKGNYFEDINEKSFEAVLGVIILDNHDTEIYILRNCRLVYKDRLNDTETLIYYTRLVPVDDVEVNLKINTKSHEEKENGQLEVLLRDPDDKRMRLITEIYSHLNFEHCGKPIWQLEQYITVRNNDYSQWHQAVRLEYDLFHIPLIGRVSVIAVITMTKHEAEVILLMNGWVVLLDKETHQYIASPTGLYYETQRGTALPQ